MKFFVILFLLFAFFFILSNLSKTKKNKRLKDFFQSQQKNFFSKYSRADVRLRQKGEKICQIALSYLYILIKLFVQAV